LAVSFSLVRFKDDVVVWRYRFDGRRKVLVKEPRIVVRTLSELLDQEMQKVLTEARKHEDHVEAIRAFIEKRKPVFKRGD